MIPGCIVFCLLRWNDKGNSTCARLRAKSLRVDSDPASSSCHWSTRGRTQYLFIVIV